MENSRFVVLTGHLNDYPLSDLVGVLRHQRKTGRLQIEYPKGPAAFFFQEGELVDAQLKSLTGLQAICVALGQSPSPFNFNPLIVSPRRSIETSMQRVVSELLGCWDENAVQVETVARERILPPPEPLAIPASTSPGPTGANDAALLALPGLTHRREPTNRTVLIMAAAGLIMAGLSTVIAVTGGFRSRAETISSAPSVEDRSGPAVQNTAELSGMVTQHQSRKNSKNQTEAAKGKEQAADGEALPVRENNTGVVKADEKAISDQSASPAAGKNEATGAAADKKDLATTEAQSVNVVMQIENGRVLKASIASHKPGMDRYEALALRIARQRRYPSKSSGQETVRITVSQPN